MKKLIIAAWLGILLTGIFTLFWYHEWIYQLPTQVPEGYQFVKANQVVNIPSLSGKILDKPVFLHFFNPSCPCSRFNIPHFRSLVKKYRHTVDFVIVVMSDKDYTEKEIQNRIGEKVEVLFDADIARLCGVYSTPQAVILDAKSRINYRGNYNKSRYCADTKTEYARIALDSLMENQSNPVFDQFALKAYGCQIPLCGTNKQRLE